MSTTTADRIAELRSQHPEITASEIARRLQVSRQRVYQAARAAGISIAADTASRKRRPARPPISRVVPAGFERPVSHTICGAISELLVAADLMARGFSVYVPIRPNRGHDLIAVRSPERPFTVQVKSTRRRIDGGYSFPADELDADVRALVVPGEAVIYRPELPE